MLFVVLRAVLVEVESEVTPVDSEVMPLVAVLSPLLVEVDKEVTLLFVVLRAVLVEVESDVTAVLVANNCEPFTASRLVPVMRPAATF